MRLGGSAGSRAACVTALSSSDRFHLLEVGLRWPPETFIQHKLRRLAARGVRVTVASSMPASAPRPRIAGLELVRMPHWEDRPLVQALGAVWEAARLLPRRPRRLRATLAAARGPLCPPGLRHGPGRWWLLRSMLSLARLDPDVVHFEWESAAARLLPLVEALGCPMAMSCRGADIDIYPHSPLERSWIGQLPLAFGTAAAVHCVSDATLSAAVAQGLSRSKASVIRPAVDPDFFAPRESPAEDEPVRLRLVDVGWLRWRKGWEYALEAVAQLAAEGAPVRFDILGADPPLDHAEPSERGRIAHTVEDLGLRDVVHVHGPVPQTEVREHLRGADILLHASLAEGIPNVVLEAMACGRPVVVTESGGTREAVDDGVEGFVVPARDTGRLVEALRTLWRDPPMRRRMGTAGRARVEAEFTLARQAELFGDFYRGMTDARPRR
jgi:glycosyltransferase involved in cell wall biosynthesis